MRFSVIFVVLSTVFSSASAAVYPRQVADCALSCLASGPMGDCASDDNACLCKNTEFITVTTQCIEQSCSGSDLTESEAFSRSLCAAVGVTLSSTPPAPSSTSSSSSSKLPSSSSGPSSSGSSSTPAPSSTPSGGASGSDGSGALSNNVNVFLGLTAAGLMTLVL